MITVSVLYPNAANSRFDMTYYLGKHMPMVQQKLGSTLKGIDVTQGLSGAEPGSQPAYLAVCNLRFDSVEAFQGIFAQHGPAILADIPNYTNVQPSVQISEVKL